MLLCPHLK